MDSQSLVAQIKQIQRSDPSAKQTWWDYCDTHLGGVRDPGRHDATVLWEFMQAYNNGSLPVSTPKPDAGKGKGGKGKGGGDWGGWGNGGDDWGNMMAMMAKAMGKGMGGKGMGGGKGASPSMVDFVKTGQRASESWKAAWEGYCTANGTGKFDPSKYDDAFISGFIEHLGGLALSSEGGMKRPAGAVAGPMAKRANMITEDPAKAQAVDRVKQLQRSDPAAKEAWGSYVDSQLAGVRDPMRHDAATLQFFLDTYSS